ncbi:MAG: AAA domain-containing protein [Accumulibacter sp.]
MKLPSESAAVLKTDEDPGREIKVQILAYDGQSGHAELAAETQPRGRFGTLTVDFKWLIERCLSWLQLNGAALKNPLLLPMPTLPPGLDVAIAGLSPEQADAARSLLSQPAAYVWGPPGTGKTRFVLAQSVAALVKAGKKVLVTAPTNLAVDNALDALLRFGMVPRSGVLRIGTPSQDFQDVWPECCEQRAFEKRWKELERRVSMIERLLKAASRLDALADATANQEAGLEAARFAEVEAQLATDNSASDLEAAKARYHEITAAIEGLHSDITATSAELGILAADALWSSVASLEAEHVGLIARKQAAQQTLSRLGFFSRVFRSRTAAVLAREIEETGCRLPVVEATLQSQRHQLSDLSKTAAALEAQASELRVRLEEQNGALRSAEGTLLRRKNELASHTAAWQQTVEQIRLIKVQLTTLNREREELLRLGPLPEAGPARSALAKEMERARIEQQKFRQDLSAKAVFGMTLDGFIGLTTRQSVVFDHIFLDEAAYAPLAKVLPLLIQGCPLVMLGDHLQLPPICLTKCNHVAESFWKTSALYLEEAFEPGIGNDATALVERAKEAPGFTRLNRSVLTRSFRFGPNLAGLLDRHVYRNGLHGSAHNDTSIECISCPPQYDAARTGRVNQGEVDGVARAVEQWLNRNVADNGSLAVLTPYVKQARALSKKLQRDFRGHPSFGRVDVLTVHRAQGREWDTVFVSVSDTGNLGSKTHTPFLTDTNKPEGLLVMNTAISRAKKHLRIFLDDQFWRERRQGSLLTDVVHRFPQACSER